VSIYLIRHGQTAGNAERRLQTPDVPLDETGAEQARRLGERLRTTPIAEVLSSDYARAHQTAQAVTKATLAPLITEPLLRERNFGKLRGRRWDDIGPGLFSEAFEPPGGETWSDFRTRAASAWGRILERDQQLDGRGHLAVVTHGMLYRLVLKQHILSETSEEPPSPGNTALTIVDPAPPHRVSLLNCTAHLEE
jgi:probable phosphoglycerate mutase